MIATIKITVAFIITVTMVKIIITMIVVKISPPAWTAWSRARIRETSVEFEGKSLRRRTWHLREVEYYYIAMTKACHCIRGGSWDIIIVTY